MNEIQFPEGIRLPFLGSNNELITISSDGTLSLGGVTVADVSGAPYVPKYFDAYDSIGGQTFTTETITLNLTQRENSGEFTLSSNEITINQDLEKVMLVVSTSTDIFTGAARSVSRSFVEIDTGGGYAELAGMRSFMYNRTSGKGAATGSSQGVFSFTAGDKIRIRLNRFTDGDTITTISNSSRVTIISLAGERGPSGEPGQPGDIIWAGQWSSGSYTINQAVENNGSSYVAIANTTEEPSITATDWELIAKKGDIGPTGSGTSINIEKNDLVVTGSPFSILNFEDGVSISQDGINPNQANITVTSSGTSFPTTVYDGKTFYRTDHQWWYTYDSTRGKWLGEIESDGGGYNGTVSNNSYLRRYNGMTMSATTGIYIPYDIAIIGVSVTNDTSVSGEMYVRRNGINVSNAYISMSSSFREGNMLLNSDFAANGVMSMYWINASNSLNNPQVRVWWRRRG